MTFRDEFKKVADDLRKAESDMWERVIGEAALNGLGLPVERVADGNGRTGLRFKCGIVYWRHSEFNHETCEYKIEARPEWSPK